MATATKQNNGALSVAAIHASAVFVALAFAVGTAAAQTYGFATLPPGTLNHTTATAISKSAQGEGRVERAGAATAGDQVIIPMIDRGEAEIGISNVMEVSDGSRGAKGFACDRGYPCAAHAVLCPQDSGMKTIADLKGKRVAMGYSAMRNIDKAARAMLATAGLTEADIKPVLVPNVVRSADDFVAAPPTCSTLPSARRKCAKSMPASGASACSKWTSARWRTPARSCHTAMRPKSRRGRCSSVSRSR